MKVATFCLSFESSTGRAMTVASIARQESTAAKTEKRIFIGFEKIEGKSPEEPEARELVVFMPFFLSRVGQCTTSTDKARYSPVKLAEAEKWSKVIQSRTLMGGCNLNVMHVMGRLRYRSIAHL